MDDGMDLADQSEQEGGPESKDVLLLMKKELNQSQKEPALRSLLSLLQALTRRSLTLTKRKTKLWQGKRSQARSIAGNARAVDTSFSRLPWAATVPFASRTSTSLTSSAEWPRPRTNRSGFRMSRLTRRSVPKCSANMQS